MAPGTGLYKCRPAVYSDCWLAGKVLYECVLCGGGGQPPKRLPDEDSAVGFSLILGIGMFQGGVIEQHFSFQGFTLSIIDA
ncbi:hypothetical protein SAMN05216210_1054 [Halopseudomonas salegens]|uniref:Uncharacterized protein n=1 Tax=Halopseudomonas salegens TaxID=1434072 RepID=A0A1H2EVU6_9GAMM|nr:hypothetical protein SAMN05216210_1054 [Halopseudomonas salegens]